MRAIVLAAGFGRRMQPLSLAAHKTLIPIAGRPMIEWIVDALLAHGIDHITVVTGYRADDLTTHLSRTYPLARIEYIHNARYAETNNIYSMALALEQTPPDDIVLIESDLIFGPEVLERLLKSPHPNVALVDRYRIGMDGTVVTLADSIVTSVIPPHLQGPAFDYSDKYKTLNIYRFAKEFCQGDFRKLLTYYANLVDSNCYYELILGILIYLQREVIHAEVLDGEPWNEIDDPNDLAVATFQFDPSSRRRLLETTHGGYWNFDVLDFSYLRNPYFPSGAVLSELRNHLGALVMQYGSAQRTVDEKLSYFLQCRAERVATLNGASQLFPLLPALVGSDRVVLPAPSFLEYARVFPNARTYPDAVVIDTEAVEAATTDADTIVFVNPNNPTGSILPTAWIEAFAARHPRKKVIVDESFIDFADEESLLGRLEAAPRDNILVVKSLSKALGVPGLRLGFVYSTDERLIEQVRSQLPIWNLNSMAEFLLETLLKHRTELHTSFEQTIAAREDFASALRALACVDNVFPSAACFLLVRLACDKQQGAEVAEELLARFGLYVKDVSPRFPGDTCLLRIAVRQPSDNRQLVSALAQVAARHQVSQRGVIA